MCSNIAISISGVLVVWQNLPNLVNLLVNLKEEKQLRLIGNLAESAHHATSTSFACRYHATWLRHNCHCSQCKQTDSGQRLFAVSRLHYTYTVKSAVIKGIEKPQHMDWNFSNFKRNKTLKNSPAKTDTAVFTINALYAINMFCCIHQVTGFLLQIKISYWSL